MIQEAQIDFPEIDDEDIIWASRLLGLPDKAFFGENGTDPRKAVIKSADSLDVAACPGSGKTTLLVAKLAILAEKWEHKTRGICVLSHTNAARREIQKRLGDTNAGRRLLSYPHFIGTIHRFIDEFLAVPWLRSSGLAIKMIDTQICEIRRWNKLNHGKKSFLQRRGVGPTTLRVIDTNFNLEKKSGLLNLGRNTPTYKSLQTACIQSALEGYFCYDDMFIWANDIMAEYPDTTAALRARFPLLFIDEAQDNSEMQSEILYRIFLANGGTVIRQRFGDANQAIFDFKGAAEARTDPFPNREVSLDLPDSYRFGQNIANLVDPLGIEPYGLVGRGPTILPDSESSSEQHTLFLFDDHCENQVLDAYGNLLLESFPEDTLSTGIFTAVGYVHNMSEETPTSHFPKSIGHYWGDYDPELSRQDPTPKSFVQYLLAGQGSAEISGETYSAVEKIAEGILRLSSLFGEKVPFLHRNNNHRQLLKQINDNKEVRAIYDELIVSFAVNTEMLTAENWRGHWRSKVKLIAETISQNTFSGGDAEEFLRWTAEENGNNTVLTGSIRRDNLYRYPPDEPKVNIRMGSIHSVKGETHTATLVLETYWQKHNLAAVKSWLMGEQNGWHEGDGVNQHKRLKAHYVAMSRPSRLLCLAMKRSTFQSAEGILDQDALGRLVNHGWIIKRLRED